MGAEQIVRQRGTGLLLGGLVVAIVASGAGGYLDWRAHQADERSGRAVTLCGLPTGRDTPLGQLLPAGGQQLEDYGSVQAPDSVSRSCTIRVDGRTALVISAGHHDGEPALPASAVQQGGTQSFGVGRVSAAWTRGPPSRTTAWSATGMWSLRSRLARRLGRINRTVAEPTSRPSPPLSCPNRRMGCADDHPLERSAPCGGGGRRAARTRWWAVRLASVPRRRRGSAMRR